MRKNVDPNVMAPCGCCMQRGSVIAARVRCVGAVKKKAPPPSNRDAKVACSGPSKDHLLNLPFRLRFLQPLMRSCGETGAATRPGASG